ncbi:hypothetical protein ACWGLG_38425 [Streptomyces antimycoticus]|nr:hypothetical protein [Streptomyces antimycoticus]
MPTMVRASLGDPSIDELIKERPYLLNVLQPSRPGHVFHGDPVVHSGL